MHNSEPEPSSPTETMDDSPLLQTRQSIRRQIPPLRGAARLLRQASGRRMMLSEPSVRVRETAAEQLEERQSDWAYSKPVIVLDILWNLAFVGVGFAVLGLTLNETPSVPLRLWVFGYVLQCLVHIGCVIAEYKKRSEAISGGSGNNGIRGSVGDSNPGLGSDEEDYGTERNIDDGEERTLVKNLESANTMFSCVWWILGFYWITSATQNLSSDSLRLYWLCITFLAVDVVFVLIGVIVACLVGIAICCCLPCIVAILYAVTDQEGATKEDIDRLPKYIFRTVVDFVKVNGEVQESFAGIMTECDADTPNRRVLSHEDVECCICLSAYDDGTELRELPCHHHFHCACIDKWLHINATCPLCKFNILKPSNQTTTCEERV